MNALLDAVVSRRDLIVGALGVAATTVVAACTGRAPSALTSSPSPSATTSTPVAIPACIVTPAETEGPYFVDERLNRSDITTDPSGGAARTGVPLIITFTVARAGGGACTALTGAQVDVWHCDALGSYSDVSGEGTTGKRYLRGYQLTDGGGAARFTTIYPGWYSGRAVHVHFKVRTFSGSSKTFEFTSQLFFDDAITDAVYKQAPYSSRPARDTRNSADMVYTSNNNSGSRLLATITPSGAGYAASFAIGLSLA